MRHQRHKNKLGVDPAHRKALLKNLCVSLIEHGSIKTTFAKCKALQPHFEKLITRAKVDNVHNRRIVFQSLNDRTAVTKLFKDIAPKFVQRPGGYTRIVKITDGRVGDNARCGYISFVE